MTATLAAASLLLAGGAGMLAALLVAPMRGRRRVLGLVMASVAALALGLVLLGAVPEAAAGLTG